MQDRLSSCFVRPSWLASNALRIKILITPDIDKARLAASMPHWLWLTVVKVDRMSFKSIDGHCWVLPFPEINWCRSIYAVRARNLRLQTKYFSSAFPSCGGSGRRNITSTNTITFYKRIHSPSTPSTTQFPFGERRRDRPNMGKRRTLARAGSAILDRRSSTGDQY